MFSQILNTSTKKYWILGFSGILITDSILILLPYIRGYAVYGRGDVLTHIGFIKDILFNGTFGGNFYPFFHIFASIIKYIPGININFIMAIIPPIFFIFYLIFIYVLSRKLFKKEGAKVILVLMFSSIPLFDSRFYTFRPSTLSFVFLPLVLWSYLKILNSIAPRKYIMLFIFLLVIPFSHPATFLFTILVFITFWFTIFIYKKINKKHISQIFQYLPQKVINKKKVLYYLVLLSFGTFIYTFWYFSFSRLREIANKNIETIIRSGSQYRLYSRHLSYMHPSMLEILKVVISRYGNIILLASGIVIFAIYFLVIKFNKKRMQKLNFYYLFFFFGFFVFAIISIIDFFTTHLQFWRVYKYAIFFSTVLIGMNFSLFIFQSSSSTKKIIKSIIIFLVFFLAIYLSVFSIYFSPKINEINNQVTHKELEGMKWFFTHRDEYILIHNLGIDQLRFYHAIYGYSYEKKNVRTWRTIETSPPSHFAYDIVNLMGEYFSGYGDVNNDGIIDIKDYRLVIIYATGYPDWDVDENGKVDAVDFFIVYCNINQVGTPHWIRADVNWDGKVNLYDIALVIQHIGDEYNNKWDAVKDLTPLSECQFGNRADVDGDGVPYNGWKVTLKDGQIIDSLISGKRKFFPTKLSLRYLVISKAGRDRYPTLYPNHYEWWKFTPTDFHKLEEDRTVLRIYDDGEFDTYFVIGSNPKIG